MSKVLIDRFDVRKVEGIRTAIVWQINEDGSKRSFSVLSYRHGPGVRIFRFPWDDSLLRELRRRGIGDPKGPFNEDVYDAARTLARKTLRDRETAMADYEEKNPQWFSPSVFPGTLSPALDEQLAGFYLLELARLCGDPSAYDEVVRTVFRNTEELRGSFSPRNTQGEAA